MGLGSKRTVRGTTKSQEGAASLAGGIKVTYQGGHQCPLLDAQGAPIKKVTGSQVPEPTGSVFARGRTQQG